MKIYDYVDDDVIKEIIEVLDNDGLIIFPTDTVYGIACNCFSEVALKKLYLSKKRSFDNPIGVLTDSMDKVNLVVSSINDLERKLMNKYFPGNLTIIFDKNKNVSDILTANKTTIGVRIPNHDIALKILKSYPYPLATTSVNISNFAPGKNVDDFLDDFSDKVEIIINGGECVDMPSTIVRVDNDKIIVLRQGDLYV